MNKIKVLIADDNEIISKSLKNIINKVNNLEIVGIANDGEEEYDFIKKLEPDLLFSDVQMPKMTGIEVIERLENENFNKIPTTVYITGENINIFNNTKIMNYVYSIIGKPFGADDVLNLIENYISENKNIKNN